MPVVIACPSCNARMKAPDNAIGKAVKCPGCGSAVKVTAPADAAPAPAPAPSRPAAKAPAPQREERDDFAFEEEEAPRKPAKGRSNDVEEEEDRPRKSAVYLGVGFNLDTDDLEITDVYDKSPAKKAKLQPGDVIVRIDGKKAKSRSDLAAALKGKKPGDEIVFELQGGDEVPVTLGKRPTE